MPGLWVEHEDIIPNDFEKCILLSYTEKLTQKMRIFTLLLRMMHIQITIFLRGSVLRKVSNLLLHFYENYLGILTQLLG